MQKRDGQDGPKRGTFTGHVLTDEEWDEPKCERNAMRPTSRSAESGWERPRRLYRKNRPMPQKKQDEDVESDREDAEMKRLRSRVARRIKKIFGKLRQISARRVWVGGVSNNGKSVGVEIWSHKAIGRPFGEESHIVRNGEGGVVIAAGGQTKRVVGFDIGAALGESGDEVAVFSGKLGWVELGSPETRKKHGRESGRVFL